jgi:Kef-type K+ transport system membrane component KefB/mannitol/fructose-specific phosphotransferase system IIA component (Ntr-type)
MTFSASEITIFFLSISVLLFFARASGELLKYFKQPMVIGEIIAGIILGPTILGFLFPDYFQKLFIDSQTSAIALQGLITLGVVMLLLISGLEIDISLLVRQGRTALLISIMGIIVPFAVGFLMAYNFPEWLGIKDINQRLIFSLFIGTALSITALPVVARTLMDLNIFKTEIGFLVIASAMFDDLVGWIIFSLILGSIGKGTHGLNVTSLVIVVVSFVIFMIIIGRKIINYILPFIIKYTSGTGGILSFVFVLGFLGAAFTEYIGVHAIFGAFIVGVAIGDTVHLKEETREVIQQFVTNIFAPLFFVSIGLHVNFIENFDLGIVISFLLLASIGKVVGCGLGAYWGGMSKGDSLAIGFGMNSRGAMEIVLGTLAFHTGLIQEKVFVALVIMALVTSIASGPLMSLFLKKSKQLRTFVGMLKPENIFFTNASSKEDVIKELCLNASKNYKMNYEKLFSEVMSREQLISTGLEKHLAIPHAKINIQNPIAAMAVHKNGVEFDSLDGLPAKIIVLLITPEDDAELQLKFLAEIAGKLENPEVINRLIESKTAADVILNIKQLS